VAVTGPRFPPSLALTPVSRWPTTLAPETVAAVLEAPVAQRVAQRAADPAVAPRTSIVIVTFDGLVFTRLCLEHLLGSTPAPAIEIVAVDNGSTDGTAAYLEAVAARDARVRPCINAANVGFAAATNQGVARARGEILLLLNNDTLVPDGSIAALTRHLDDPDVGIVGAVTNRAGNEAQIDAPYRTCGELARFAAERARRHAGERFDLRTVTMFCAALRRRVWDEIGPLDEQFEIGMFEDDDYAMRVRQAGRRVVCAGDVFVHHFGQGSLGHLGPTGEYGRLFHANRARWEAKWRCPWEPHRRRETVEYRELVDRVRRTVREAVPSDATVLMISRGDADLLNLDGRRAWHFPQAADGTYAGHYPPDSDACIAHLERLRDSGASVLVIPQPALWWLDHYREFKRHLETKYRLVRRADDTGVVFALGDPSSGPLTRSAFAEVRADD
jgi:GT2 family glycosyltransferase